MAVAGYRPGGLPVAQLGAQLVVPGNDVAPVMLAGVLHQHQHLAELTQLRQRLDGLHRQGRHAKHHQPRRQAGRTLARGLAGRALRRKCDHEAGMHAGA